MKVYLGPRADAGSGGMYRVLDGLYRYLPCEITDNPQEADVIHAQIALYDTVPNDKPLVVSSHGLLWKEDRWGNIAPKTNRLCIASYIQADVVTAPSHFVARAIARNCLVKPQVVHHGIDSVEWVPDRSEGYILWNKARVDPANNPDAVNTLARNSNREFVSTFGMPSANVHITGRVSPEDMRKITGRAGVYLATARESGGPCFGVLEAMSCGVPILSWNYGGTAEVIVHGETGYLAEYGNYEDLLEGVEYCLAHRDRLGQAARQLVIDNYQWEDVIHGYMQAYEAAINPGYVRDRVSVIITSHNLDNFIEQSVYSALNQTWPDTEVIVVDDASTDTSVEKLEEFGDKIRLVKNPVNLHVSESRNTGIRQATGEYILPLDGDDRLYNDSIQNLMENITRQKPISAGMLHIFHETDLDGKYVTSGWPNDTDVLKQIRGYNRIPYSSLYHRRVWQNTGGYRRRIRIGVEDADLWTRAFSYGYHATLVDKPVLRYTKREGPSLGKINQSGHTVWTNWFGWHFDETVAPIGTGITGETWSFDSPEVSVIVPVGPGHLPHLQTCMDSLVAQTYVNWEVIAVNDTGFRWFDDDGNDLTTYTGGMGFVRFIDSDTNRGVAAARNAGINAARGKRLVFLDVDDIAQPTLIEILVKSQDLVDGWLYTDWYAVTEDGVIESEAEDWDYDKFVSRSLGPITGIFWTRHVKQIGGFDEQIPGWEDWDFQLRLVQKGICGTRIKAKLLVYNMHLGWRREDNFRDRENLLQYIDTKYGEMRGKKMACSTCGGRSSISVRTNTQGTANMANELDTLMVFKSAVESGGSITYKPPTNPMRAKYKVYPNRPFYVFSTDVDWFLRHKGFEVISKPEQNAVDLVEQAPLTTNLPMQPSTDHLIVELDLDLAILSIIGKEFSTVESLKNANDADILSIKGVGEQRLAEIKEALEKWNTQSM